MPRMSTSEMETISVRFPQLLQRSLWQRYRIAIIGGITIVYMIFCSWFFSIGHVFGSANWGLAGSYLADWVSFEVRPDIKIAPDRAMSIVFPKFTPIGDDPHPDWLNATREQVTRTINVPATASTAASTASKSTSSFMATPAKPASDATAATTQTRVEDVVTRAAVTFYPGADIVVTPDLARVTRDGETITIALMRDDTVTADAPLPSWASQRRPGEKIVLSFGFSGWAEIEDDRVKIRKRFFGWANFFYDTNSRYFDMPMGQFVSTLFSSERLDPKQGNLSLAAYDFLYNPSWQHLDVWTKLLQTIVMAFVGTLFATIIAFPLSFLAARNLTNSRALNQVTKRFFDFQRSVDMLIWALFFTRAFGPGPLAGISAIFLTDTGTLGKLYSEALENIDNKQPEGIKSVGASPLAVRRFGIIPQVLPVFVSQALYFWESNTRSATIIGAVGAGGIGLKLWEAMRTNSDWENVAYMVVLILIVVYIFDGMSNALRSRLTGQNAQQPSR